jgi:hypothetical protein
MTSLLWLSMARQDCILESLTDVVLMLACVNPSCKCFYNNHAAVADVGVCVPSPNVYCYPSCALMWGETEPPVLNTTSWRHFDLIPCRVGRQCNITSNKDIDHGKIITTLSFTWTFTPRITHIAIFFVIIETIVKRRCNVYCV